MESSQFVMKFPCDFPLKIIGSTNADLEQILTPILSRHIPEFNSKQISTKFSSSNNKYISLTVKFEATSRKQLDDLYQELTSHPDILMVL